MSEERSENGLKVFDFEKSAMMGEELPSGLKMPDMLLFIGLRGLYDQYRKGVVSRAQAVLEKRKLLKQHSYQDFLQKSAERWVEMIKETEAARNAFLKDKTIENAEKIIQAIARTEKR